MVALLAASMGRGELSWDLLADLEDLLHYHFMRNALFAGTLLALVAGAVGYLMVLHGQSFTGHALANAGFAGAAGATLVGIPVTLGLLAFGVCAALSMGWLEERRAGPQIQREVAVGTTLAFCLGLGLLFERLASSYAGGVYAILFGATVGVSDSDVVLSAALAALSLVTLALVGRPLLFASLDPEVAAARGVPVRALGYLFLALIAVAVAEAAQVVGVLLIFAILVAPGTIAQQVTSRPGRALGLSMALALLLTWSGLAVAYFSPYPVGFCLTTLAFGAYLLARLGRGGAAWLARRRRTAAPSVAGAEGVAG